MSLGRLFEPIGPMDRHVKETSGDQAVETLEGLGARDPVIGEDLDSRESRGFGLNAVGIGDPSALPHVFERLCQSFGVGGDQRGIEALGKVLDRREKPGTSPVDGKVGAQSPRHVDAVRAG